jgi:hypothetical protein
VVMDPFCGQQEMAASVAKRLFDYVP